MIKTSMIHSSSKKTLIYHLGSEGGFYSEFNNMVLAILYCYKHHINFKLYSKDANFAYENGWTDYFEPFCKEVTASFHSAYNIRQPMFIPNRRKFRILKNLYKILYHFNYYTFELWRYFHNGDFEKERFYYNNQDMDILDASQYVINKIWKYNEHTQTLINSFLKNISLPNKYVGLHIRRGDKVIEHKNEDIDIYMMKLKQHTDIKDIFVYTDSYDVIASLRETYPHYTFYSLVDESEHGYFHQEFIKKGKDDKIRAILKMFTSIDILAKAEYCIGTFSTNPGMFLGMRMPKGRMIGVDYDYWRIW